MLASSIIGDVLHATAGDPVFLTGSLVAEDVYGMSNAHSDVDLFTPNMGVCIALGQKLMCQGYTLDDRFERVWYRWLRYGVKNWHTNSLRLTSPGGVQTNLVYKTLDGHPTTSLSQVIESFDFGLLAVGYDCETGTFRDLRNYLFPGADPKGPLPLMPNKRANWRLGFISKYNGIRQAARYAKYYEYGYDLSLVQDDLVTGYFEGSAYLSQHFDADKQLLGKIYDLLGRHIEANNIDELKKANKEIDFNDELDVIWEALV